MNLKQKLARLGAIGPPVPGATAVAVTAPIPVAFDGGEERAKSPEARGVPLPERSPAFSVETRRPLEGGSIRPAPALNQSATQTSKALSSSGPESAAPTTTRLYAPPAGSQISLALSVRSPRRANAFSAKPAHASPAVASVENPAEGVLRSGHAPHPELPAKSSPVMLAPPSLPATLVRVAVEDIARGGGQSSAATLGAASEPATPVRVALDNIAQCGGTTSDRPASEAGTGSAPPSTDVSASAAARERLSAFATRVATALSSLPAPTPARIEVDGAASTSAGDRIRRGLAALAPSKVPAASPAPSARAKPEIPLPVEPVQTSSGLLHLRSLPHEAAHHHGTVMLARAARVAAGTVAKLALDPALGEIDFSRALFLDLETTGLAGGTGTLPVVVGLAWFENGAFQMEQLFLRRPGEERPMLARVSERLAAASNVVTYNGKTFDWPLLRSRYVMNRLKAPTPPPHLDLLHCARRVFKWRGSGTRLADIEREVIGYRRVGDVDGAQIPELYFRYLRSGNASPLVPVLEHNVYDIRLLAALLAHLGEQFDAETPQGDLRDLLGLGQVAFRAEDLERAERFAARASGCSASEIAAEGLMLTARVALRHGKARPASEALEAALRKCRAEVRGDLHLALAKIYEHRLRDFASALRHAAKTQRSESEKERARRIERLSRRAERSTPAGP